MTTAKADQALQHVLHGFSPREGPSDIWIRHRRACRSEGASHPGVLLFLLTRVMGIWTLGIEEKTAWHVPGWTPNAERWLEPAKFHLPRAVREKGVYVWAELSHAGEYVIKYVGMGRGKQGIMPRINTQLRHSHNPELANFIGHQMSPLARQRPLGDRLPDLPVSPNP